MKNRPRVALAAMGAGVKVDGIEAWDRIGRELALVDPDRFVRFLHAAEAVVAIYETQDPDRALAMRAPLIAGCDSSIDA